MGPHRSFKATDFIANGLPDSSGRVARFEDRWYSQGSTAAEYQKQMATGPESISSPMDPKMTLAKNSVATAKEKRSLLLKRR